MDDEEGEYVADNIKIAQDLLDRFYKPYVFGAPVEDIQNNCPT
jgi:hypothetical protein